MAKYNRQAAVSYAHRWAYDRNPAFYNYELIGGDCTNFASQCLYAGGSPMNYEPHLGWYYISANLKAPSWTGVEYLYNFLTREAQSVGPKARLCSISELLPGDIVQLSLGGNGFHHSPVVVNAAPPYRPEDILLAAHSYDTDNRPLSTYAYSNIRYLHILSE